MKTRLMYACFAFFPNGEVKRWKYVTNLTTFTAFLNRKHSSWKYFNVYKKDSRSFIKRIYPGNHVPKFLSVFFLLLSFNLIARKNTFDRATFNKTTFINGFNNTATISTDYAVGGVVRWQF